MAIKTLTDARVEVNSVNISDHVKGVTIESSRDEVDVTTMGSVNKVIIPGLGDATITVDVFTDAAAGSLDSQMAALYASTTPFPVKVRWTSSGITTSNAEYSISANLFTFNPIAGSVGDASETSLVFRNGSQTGLARATS